ncbi:hypothetical protein EC988_001320, partial [Linderina pennispora]
MSLLTHRNTRALLVPLICVLLLLPAAMCAEERRQATQSTGFVAHSTATVVPVHTDISKYDATTAGIIALAQSSKGSEQATQTAFESLATPVTYSVENDEEDTDGSPRRPEALEDERPAFLEQGSQAAVPRKFTVPDSVIVAEADSKHIAILPAKPLAAVARQHGLLKRDMVARSGVGLVEMMVVVTVDGRLYGVNRYDGSIVWQRDGLGGACSEATGIYAGRGKTRCPRGMVWTRSSSVDFAQGSLNASQSALGFGHGNETLWEEGDVDADDERDYDNEDDDEEEEWLLEQGIDWRSDPQVLERQRQQRREWLARQRKKARGHRRRRSSSQA